MRLVNWLGVSRCRLIEVDGLDLHVEELDAVDGTPVLDIKPWFAEFGPRGDIRQAAWSVEMLDRYYTDPPSNRIRATRATGDIQPLPTSDTYDQIASITSRKCRALL